MNNKTMNGNASLAKQEFSSIISNYILPLFDTRGNLKLHEQQSNNKQLITFSEAEGMKTVNFYPFIASYNSLSPFYYSIGTYSQESVLKSSECILSELLKVAEYDYKRNYSIKRYYGKGKSRQEAFKMRTLDLAFELGICKWLTATQDDSVTLHSIISKMIEWAGRTYEGKNVPFGLVVDFSTEASDNAADYLHFLENDSSAVFTDGIFSGILLDRKGKVLSFLTRQSKVPENPNNYKTFTPYQFTDIANHCVGNTIGIIVLTNGEILLIKNRALCFAKRGRKWINFDWERVYYQLRPYFKIDSVLSDTEIKNRIQSIYCTILDVSFAHTGGCLAIIHPNLVEQMSEAKIVVDRFDLYTAGEKPAGMRAENKEKAEILSYLLKYPNTQIRSFFDLEMPLKKEILSLDGATVVSLDGKFFCAGSIVSVGGGSSGGGRTAAALRLSNYGVGIKISEDGYIEAYGIPVDRNGKIIENPEKRKEPLFKFK